MFTYYGQISWQTLAVFAAAGSLIAILPLGFCRKPILVFWADEILALMFFAFGAAFFRRYQNFAHRWIHVDGNTAVEDLTDKTETGGPYRPPGHPQPRPPWPTITVEIGLAVLVASFIIFVWVLYTIPCV